MTEQPRHRVGKAGRAIAPGRQARRPSLVVAVLALVAGVLAVATWLQQADLRDVDDLVQVTATVTGVDEHRRSADTLNVDFEAAGVSQRADIPYGGSAENGDEVAVAFVSDDPTRVRTVEDWYPAYGT